MMLILFWQAVFFLHVKTVAPGGGIFPRRYLSASVRRLGLLAMCKSGVMNSFEENLDIADTLRAAGTSTFDVLLGAALGLKRDLASWHESDCPADGQAQQEQFCGCGGSSAYERVSKAGPYADRSCAAVILHIFPERLQWCIGTRCGLSCLGCYTWKLLHKAADPGTELDPLDVAPLLSKEPSGITSKV